VRGQADEPVAQIDQVLGGGGTGSKALVKHFQRAGFAGGLFLDPVNIGEIAAADDAFDFKAVVDDVAHTERADRHRFFDGAVYMIEHIVGENIFQRMRPLLVASHSVLKVNSPTYADGALTAAPCPTGTAVGEIMFHRPASVKPIRRGKHQFKAE
jgi:hypothetical protein